ncbi:MAG TPA: lanthionine synthetase LanC family protein [Burkholderiaceae bacterium]|nr:lanthionine synthetase LanC family protein [Burkholderiaceae bacterium]
MSIDGLLLLPDDVRIVPVLELPPEIRARIDASDDDYAITRSRSRLATSIVDRESAELLANFRQPVRIVDAIVAYAGRLGHNPEATLDAAYPVLSHLYRTRLLVPVDSDEAGRIDGELRAGDEFDGLRLLRRVQILDNNEVFLARDGAGRYAAVKFYRNADARVSQSLEREATLLRRAGARAPAVFGLSRVGSGIALVTEWISGAEALSAAAAFQGHGQERNEHAMLSLCVRIASAFADLHEAGLLHGDVHPRNILVEASGSVRLIDFGLAREIKTLSTDDARGGVPFYFEPEYAGALRQQQSTAPSPAGEQYAIAALLYQLWTGVHYLDWSLEREEMLRQIVEDDPVGFEARRVPAWPALEQVLRRALDKSAQRRFPDLRSLTDAMMGLLEQAQARDHRHRRRRPVRAVERGLLDRALDRYALGGEAFRDGLRQAPFASINYGAAGIAYALMRIAQRRLDPGLLAAADLWSQKAYALAPGEGAFYCAELQIERETVGAISLFHSASGLHCVRALVSAAQGDAASANCALQAFVEHSRRRCAAEEPTAAIDLTLGAGSLLLGCAELIESIPDLALFDLGCVRARGEEIAGELLALLRAEPIESAKDLRMLGIAHGWGGLLFAALRWARAMHREADIAVQARLQELAMLAEPHGAGLRWPVRHIDPLSTDGWCNGSAGHAMLFALAHQVFTESGFGEVAERAAISASLSESPLGTLCCGQGGIGYSLLALHRLTGSDVWLQRARTAARRASADRSKHFLPDALYKGAVGVALLVEDLANPASAAMPLFEPVS